MADKTILVTGGRGFIGCHVADCMRERGWHVRSFDTALSVGHPDDVCGDTRNIEQIRREIAGCDGVIHLAAVSRERIGADRPVRCIETNVLGTVNVLEAARRSARVPWVIMGSTRDVPDGTYTAGSLYGASWLAAEIIAARYAEDYDMSILALRLSDVYGSARDHKDKVLPTLTRKAMAGEPLTIDASGRLFDFTHYTDVQRAFALGADWIAQHGGFHSATICTGRSITIRGLAQLILRRANTRAAIIAQGNSSHDTQIHNDTEQASSLLGFKTRILLEDGIDMLVKSMREKATA